MLRILDIFLSIIGLFLGFPLLFIIFIVSLLANGSPIFYQQRLGLRQRPFTLVKFRTMNLGVMSVPSHLSDPSEITSLGKFLRKTKLDELPQLWNVLKGEMSFVGPRPCLINQFDLIAERNSRGIFLVRPGITGLAQINNIDMSTPKLLAETEEVMIESLSVKLYFKYILMTILGKGGGDVIQNVK